jgi:hypothetical protein
MENYFYLLHQVGFAFPRIQAILTVGFSCYPQSLQENFWVLCYFLFFVFILSRLGPSGPLRFQTSPLEAIESDILLGTVVCKM